ncbi:PAS domain S-box protein [Desulfonatronovibrio magnus]|uniref:PAS domain S-box protein n=1 Tax=Desulfonatronovibrio magnus TaxID=698827 RepID=UPI0005EB70E7|nr:PAS domain S-box protein [Desulfonatronovibrio magnus]
MVNFPVKNHTGIFHDSEVMFIEAPIGIFMSTPDGRVLSANPYAARMFGYDTPQEALSGVSHISQLYANPDDRTALIDILNSQGAIHNYECRLKNKTGTAFWASINVRVIQKEDQDDTYYIGFITSIDRAKQAEEELKVNEARYKELVDNANSIFLRMDSQGNVIYFNEYAQSFFGYKAEQIIGRNVVGTIVPEVDVKGVKLDRLIQEIGKNPEKYSNNENENMLACGTRVWIAWTNKAITDAKGEVVEVLCIGRDVTDMRNALDRMHASQARYKAIVEDSPAMLCRFLPGCKLTYVNDLYCQYFNRSREELLGKSFLSLIPESHHKSFLANLASLTPEDPVISHEHEVITPDGDIRWQRWTERAIFNAQGGLMEFQSIGEDVTELKQIQNELKASNEKYHAVYKKSPIAISILDKHGGILDSNPACQELFGFKDGEAMKGYQLLQHLTIKESNRQRLNKGMTITVHQTLDFQHLKELFQWNSSRIGFACLEVRITPLGLSIDEGYMLQMQDITWCARSKATAV